LIGSFSFAEEVRIQEKVKVESMAAAISKVPEIAASRDTLLMRNPQFLKSVRQTVEL